MLCMNKNVSVYLMIHCTDGMNVEKHFRKAMYIFHIREIQRKLLIAVNVNIRGFGDLR